MKRSTINQCMISGAAAMVLSMPGQAAVELYNTDETKVSVDASFNTFYVRSDSDNEIADTDRTQSRVKMGLLPNWIGFNFSKKIDDLTVGGRSSFWVTINDSDTGITSTGIDVRQFYGTVDGSWGQILFGKDFTLFSRSNIFLDEMLMGYGAVNDTLGLIDGQGVSFGHIGSGYFYPFPHSQITYRTPDMGGFKVAVGIVDPGNATTDTGAGRTSEEENPRFEAEATFHTAIGDNSAVTAWLGFLQQSSESQDPAVDDVDSLGTSYGVKVKLGGLSLHASGFQGEGLGLLLGPGTDAGLGLQGLISENGEEVDSDGYVAQASYAFGSERFVVSYGETTVETATEWNNETSQIAWFHDVNSVLRTVVEYNINTLAIGSAEEETKTVALGLIANF
ncbi:porin [Pseudomaricurvus sp. HS19]|uniref:porin n=1 Tax=Pseudomaricurvus sp. HS19 TaxID=2692626 RepID=UPI0013680689|nr:porin [Pseudomaricurvus sp. HS19]MYM64857.1 porin [Pseudomaricurvus sp. HS19]